MNSTFLKVFSRILFTTWPFIIALPFLVYLKKRKNSDGKLLLQLTFVVWLFLLSILIITKIYPIKFFEFVLEEVYVWVFYTMGGALLLLNLKTLLQNLQEKKGERDFINNLSVLNSLSPCEFENIIANYFQSLGFRTWKTSGVNDHGVDILVYDGKGNKWIVQCKRYKGSVGEPILRDLFGSMIHEKASKAFLMTTGKITTKAEVWLEGKPIIVYQGKDLVRLLKKRT